MIRSVIARSRTTKQSPGWFGDCHVVAEPPPRNDRTGADLLAPHYFIITLADTLVFRRACGKRLAVGTGEIVGLRVMDRDGGGDRGGFLLLTKGTSSSSVEPEI